MTGWRVTRCRAPLRASEAVMAGTQREYPRSLTARLLRMASVAWRKQALRRSAIDGPNEHPIEHVGRRRCEHPLAANEAVDDLDVAPVVPPGLHDEQMNAVCLIDARHVHALGIEDDRSRGDPYDAMRHCHGERHLSVHPDEELAGVVGHQALGR